MREGLTLKSGCLKPGLPIRFEKLDAYFTFRPVFEVSGTDDLPNWSTQVSCRSGSNLSLPTLCKAFFTYLVLTTVKVKWPGRALSSTYAKSEVSRKRSVLAPQEREDKEFYHRTESSRGPYSLCNGDRMASEKLLCGDSN